MTYQLPISIVPSKKETFKQRIVALVSALAVFGVPLFLSVTRLIGYKYTSREESPVYIIYMVSVFSISLFLYLTILFKTSTIKKTEFSFYIFIIWLFFNHAIRYIVDSGSITLITRALYLFGVMSLPSLFAAKILNHYNAFACFIRLMEFITILMAIGLFSIGIIPFFSGMGNSGIEQTYQGLSYYSATAFGLLGFYTFRAGKEFTYSYVKQKVRVVINVSLMILLLLSTILSGGRGGFILIMLYVALILYWVLLKEGLSKRTILRILTGLSIVLMVFVFAYRQILENSWLSRGFARAISFINDGKIDLEGGSSGRDKVYDTAIHGISESPIWGYGPFTAWDRVIYPHNFFLDISLQFGIPFASLIVIFLLFYIFKIRKNWTTEKAFLLVIISISLVSLSFSGSYLTSPFIWFSLVSYSYFATPTKKHMNSVKN